MVRPLSERRKYIRVGEKHVLEVEKYSFKGIDLKKDVEAATKNFSAGGILFESKRQLEIGDTLKLKVKIHGWEKYKTEFIKPNRLSKSEPLVVLAKVVRVEIVKSGQLYDIGVSFVGIDRDYQRALTKFIKKKLNAL